MSYDQTPFALWRDHVLNVGSYHYPLVLLRRAAKSAPLFGWYEEGMAPGEAAAALVQEAMDEAEERRQRRARHLP